MVRPRRTEDRITKRFDIRFHIGGKTYEATTSNLSPHGLFIRTKHCFKAGAKIRMELTLAEGNILFLEGTVRRAILTRLAVVKNGMGVELNNPEGQYLDLVAELDR